MGTAPGIFLVLSVGIFCRFKVFRCKITGIGIGIGPE